MAQLKVDAILRAGKSKGEMELVHVGFIFEKIEFESSLPVFV